VEVDIGPVLDPTGRVEKPMSRYLETDRNPFLLVKYNPKNTSMLKKYLI